MEIHGIMSGDKSQWADLGRQGVAQTNTSAMYPAGLDVRHLHNDPNWLGYRTAKLTGTGGISRGPSYNAPQSINDSQRGPPAASEGKTKMRQNLVVFLFVMVFLLGSICHFGSPGSQADQVSTILILGLGAMVMATEMCRGPFYRGLLVKHFFPRQIAIVSFSGFCQAAALYGLVFRVPP